MIARLCCCLLFGVLASRSVAQVDLAPRRLLLLQSSVAVADSEEQLGGFAVFWFNQDRFPWDNTALRVLYGGIYLDTELSIFWDDEHRSAFGIGIMGGPFVGSITPYVKGERLARQSYYGDVASLRLFLNHELGRIDLLGREVPVNLRGTYLVNGQFYRTKESTAGFVIPNDFFQQTIRADLRIGGIRPAVPTREAFEALLGAEAAYRSGFDAFGPVGAPFPAHSEYQRVLASVAGRYPVGEFRLYGRLATGWGTDVDQLSAWRLGGNLMAMEAFSQTLHGYYSREFMAKDFGMVNLEISHPLVEEHQLTVHLYGDWAVLRGVPPLSADWHNYFGTGAGLSFVTIGDIRALVNYGYGINALRNGDRGGHEIGLALQRQF